MRRGRGHVSSWRELTIVVYAQLQRVASFVTYDVLNLTRGTRLGSAVEFFAFEVPKVLLLLTAVVFIVGIFRSFVTPERMLFVSPERLKWRS